MIIPAALLHERLSFPDALFFQLDEFLGVCTEPTVGRGEIAYALTDAWKNYSLPVRRAVADVLVTRSKWSRALLA